MKIKFQFIILFFLTVAVLSCKKDNYKAPASKLTGHLMYKGDSIGVEIYQVPFELYQYGFGRVSPIGSSFAQDGSYSALLFDGDYKFIIPNGQGPFVTKQTTSGVPDSLAIALRGNMNVDIEVTPYYMIRNVQFSGGGNKVTATCKIEKIITDPAIAKNIEDVRLYVNKTQFVSDGDNNINSTTLSGSAITDPNNVSLSVNVPTIVPTQNYVFARIGVKIAGVEDRIFSKIQKVQF